MRPDWDTLVSTLMYLYDKTLPGVYMHFALPAIPTPPSSLEDKASSSCSEKSCTCPTEHQPFITNPAYIYGISPLNNNFLQSPPGTLFNHGLGRRTSEESGYESNFGV